MSGPGLESLMEGWSLNDGIGALKKGSSMNAMRSSRGGMGTAGGHGGGIRSSSQAADASDPFFGAKTASGDRSFSSPSSGSMRRDAVGVSSLEPVGGSSNPSGDGGAGLDDIFGLGTSTSTPLRPTSSSAANPIATPGAPPASDFFLSPAASNAGTALSSSPMKQNSSSDPFGGIDDLLGLGVGMGAGAGAGVAGARGSMRESTTMNGAPMLSSGVDSLDDLLGDGGSNSSGPASSFAAPPVQGAMSDDVDFLGALFGAGPAATAAAGATSAAGLSSGVSSTSTPGETWGETAGGSSSPGGFTGGASGGGGADDLLGDLLVDDGGVAGMSSLHVSSPVPVTIPMTAGEDVSSPASVDAPLSAGVTAAGEAGETGGGSEGGEEYTTIGAAVARAQERVTASSPPASVAPVTDGFAGFEDFVTSASGANTNGASVRGDVGVGNRGEALGSLEDLFNASTTGGGAAGASGGVAGRGTGMSLGDDLDAMFGAPSASTRSGGGLMGDNPSPMIDDMFGPAMGAAFSGAGGAGMIGSQVAAEEITYQPGDDDEDQEGDTEHRKELRRQRHDRNRARIAGKLQEKRDREAAAIAEQAERQVLQDLIGADIDDWLRSNQGNVRTMLANLGDVLWEGHAYKSPGLNDLISPAAVRKSYHKALVVIHPDKVRQKGGDTAMVYIADKVFDQVRDAFKAMEAKEL